MTDIVFNVLIIGSTNTGKTSLVIRYLENKYTDSYNVTVLPKSQAISKTTTNGINYELILWDTAGSEAWISMNANTYHLADAIIYLCSYDSQDSVGKLQTFWKPLIDQYRNPKEYISYLCVNKADLERKTVSNEELNSVAKALSLDSANEEDTQDSLKIFCVSAKDPSKGQSLDEMFVALGEDLCKMHIANPPPPKPVLEPEQPQADKKKGCC